MCNDIPLRHTQIHHVSRGEKNTSIYPYQTWRSGFLMFYQTIIRKPHIKIIDISTQSEGEQKKTEPTKMRIERSVINWLTIHTATPASLSGTKAIAKMANPRDQSSFILRIGGVLSAAVTSV